MLTPQQLHDYARALPLGLGVLPLDHPWRHDILIPIPKTHTRPSPRDFRPIRLTELDYRALDAFITNHYTQLWDQHNYRHPAQFGFRKGHSCSDALMTLRAAIDRSSRDQSSLTLLSTDVSKAFDRVPPWTTALALTRMGVSSGIVSFLTSLCSTPFSLKHGFQSKS